MYQVCLSYTVDHYQSYHTIGGVPQGGSGRSSCFLTDQHHMIKYSTTLHIPLWIAYRMNGPSEPVCLACEICECCCCMFVCLYVSCTDTCHRYEFTRPCMLSAVLIAQIHVDVTYSTHMYTYTHSVTYCMCCV